MQAIVTRRVVLASKRPLHQACFAPAFRKYATEAAQSKAATSTPPPPRLDKKTQPVPLSQAPIELNDLGKKPPKEVEATSAKEKAVEPAVKGTRWQRIVAVVKHEAAHYWNGTKLLAKEVRISAGLLRALLRGRKLTRREHRQLKRTTNDLLRLIPFSVFVIVPFMELLLPVALKLFPNMLPSTFTDKHKEDEKKRKLLKVRIQMAKFLQETLRESGVKSPEKIKDSAEFKEFFRKVRATGESPSTDDIVRVAKLFDDDLTLENLSRPQLVGMCRYMNLHAFGTDNFLRHTLRNRLDHIMTDDKAIDSEGVKALQDFEVIHACQSRGIRTDDVPIDKLREHLAQWIDMHVHHGLSGTLLVLSRAFAYHSSSLAQSEETTITSLKDALASLPDALLNVTELKVSSDTMDYKKRLEIIKEQEELIEDEKEQEEREAIARQEAKEAKEQEEREAEATAAAAEQAKADSELAKAEEVLPQEQVQALKEEAADEDNVRMTQEQVNELGAALSILAAKSSVLNERADLKALYEDNLRTEEESKTDPDPNAVALGKRIRAMIKKIDAQLEEYDAEVGAKMNTIAAREDGRLSVEDLAKALREIRHRPDDEHIGVLLEKLDIDKDGFVPLSDIMSLAEGEGLGIVLDEAETAASLLSQGQSIRSDVAGRGSGSTQKSKAPEKLRKEDVVSSD